MTWRGFLYRIGLAPLSEAITYKGLYEGALDREINHLHLRAEQDATIAALRAENARLKGFSSPDAAFPEIDPAHDAKRAEHFGGTIGGASSEWIGMRHVDDIARHERGVADINRMREEPGPITVIGGGFINHSIEGGQHHPFCEPVDHELVTAVDCLEGDKPVR